MNKTSPLYLLAHRQNTLAGELGVFAVTVEAVSPKVLEESDEFRPTARRSAPPLDARLPPAADLFAARRQCYLGPAENRQHYPISGRE
jgi:hypothetical protein